jgi:hypothetical protein
MGALVRVERQLRQHPGGEFMDWIVIDDRTGEDLASRGERSEPAEFAEHLNASYPPGTPAPAHDSLVHEIHMQSIGCGEPEKPLYLWASDEVNLCGLIPDGISHRPELWKPGVER